jgi:predicted ATP-grasp superfamily ATP-dependent carboligase
MRGIDSFCAHQTRILITDGETRGVVAAARGLHKAGFAVAVAVPVGPSPAPASWSRHVAERLYGPHPLDDESGFVAALERALGRGEYAALVAGSDASLLSLSRARERLARYVLPAFPDVGVVEKIVDKLTLASAAARVGLDSPPMIACRGVTDALCAAREWGFPVIVKPVRSVIESGEARRQLGAASIADEIAMQAAVRATGERCLVQRSEAGTVVSFAGVFADGRLIGEAFSRYCRTWKPEAGNVSFSETSEPPPELREQVIALVRELGWQGLFELELIDRDVGGYAAIDFNPRAYGSLALAIRAGANLQAVWCEHVLGRDPAPVRARSRVRYRWEEGDARYALRQLQLGNLSTAAAVMRVRRRVVHAMFELTDPGPFLANSISVAQSVRKHGKQPPGPQTTDSDPRAVGRAPDRKLSRGGCDAVVIGAGPYGLSATAHLRAAGIAVKCFGEPLAFWRRHMPAGMILRSLRRATHIADPNRALMIDQYERAEGRKLRSPSLGLDEFIEYASWFQTRAAPDLDTRAVVDVRRENGRFAVRLEDGGEFETRHVVVATGLAPFARRPSPFRSLPDSLVSHSSDHARLDSFAGKRVVVIGGGQSALESAALLREYSATVEVVARAPDIRWLPDDTRLAPRELRPHLPLPPTGVGGGSAGWLVAIPDAFRRTPRRAQPQIAQRCTLPAGSGWLRPRLTGVTISCHLSTVAAEARQGAIRLLLDDGSERVADHVLLATGFEVDVERYPFLAPDLMAGVERVDGYPKLGPGLESSIPGLHFLGAPAALSFGPVMRFVVGTWYAAPALTLRVLGRRQPPFRPAFPR